MDEAGLSRQDIALLRQMYSRSSPAILVSTAQTMREGHGPLLREAARRLINGGTFPPEIVAMLRILVMAKTYIHEQKFEKAVEEYESGYRNAYRANNAPLIRLAALMLWAAYIKVGRTDDAAPYQAVAAEELLGETFGLDMRIKDYAQGSFPV